MLKIVNLSKSYQDKVIYKDLNVSFSSTGLIGIMGKSGSGKTTLLNLLGLIDKPTSGEIHYGDLNLTNLNELDKSHFRREHIGFIFQDHQLIPSLNVYENIKMGLTFAGLPTNDVDNKINTISENLNIYDLLKQNIETLSGGEKQRVSIARTLIKDPSVILADEPTGSLDYEQAQEVLKILKEISKNRLVIIVSHDQMLLETYGNEIYTLKDRTLHVDQPKETTSTKAIKINKTKLKNRFLFGYALNNLSIHKLRTFILSLILVISMIGIILSYHFNQSLNNYIEENEQKLVDIFPVEVDQISVTVKDLNPSEDFPKYPNFQYALPSNIQNEYLHLNTLDYGFYTYMQNMPNSLYEQLTYFYDIDLNFIKHTNQYSFFGYNINPLFKSENQIEKEFDTLYENNDSVADYNLTLVLDDYNRIPLTLINSLGLPVNEPLSFESIGELTLYYISNDDLYEETNPNLYTQKDLNNLDENLYRSVKISRIIRQKDSYEFFNLNPGIYLNKDDYESLYYENKNSDIVIRQQEINTHILSGLSFQENNPKVRALKTLGYAEFPTSYRIMAKDRTSKLNIIAYIESYSGNTIIPLDKAELGLDVARSAFEFFRLIGYLFITISLITSTTMIGLTTYTSIVERATEIGILKTLGAANNDITKSFGFELLFIGFVASLLGIVVSLISIPLLNIVLYDLLSIRNVLRYDLLFLILFGIISIVYVVVTGLIPVVIHNKKQAIENIKYKL